MLLFGQNLQTYFTCVSQPIKTGPFLENITWQKLRLSYNSKLNFHSHISEMRRNCFHQLKRFNSIRRFVPQDQFAILIHAFITSRIDFCYSIFYSLPENLVSRVQTIQNSCAKCLSRVNRFATATEARITLHWLPSRARSRFKILVFAHKVVHLPNSVPHYISAPYSTRDHGRTTRFNVSNTLKCDFKRRLLTVGGRSLNHTLPSVWNSLPQELRDIQSFSSFKSSLKTFLF